MAISNTQASPKIEKSSTSDNLRNILGDAYQPMSSLKAINPLPTGLKAIDNTSGIGGLPRGRMVEIAGESHSGKSTLCLNILKNIQTNGGVGAWFNIGEGFDINYALNIGVKENTPVISPKDGETFHALLLYFLALEIFDIIFVDCIQALTTKEVQERKDIITNMHENMSRAKLLARIATDLSGGFQAKDINTGKIIPSSYKTVATNKIGKLETDNKTHRLEDKKTCVIFISRLKEDPSVIWGKKTYTAGGVEKNFLYSLRYELSARTGEFKQENKEKVLEYREVKIKNTKNKVGIPYKESVFYILPSGLIQESPPEKGKKKNG